MSQLIKTPQAILELKRGKPLIVTDGKKRENQGDLIFPAQTITPKQINFMLRECKGLVCAPITQEQASRLDLALMVPKAENTEKTGVNFTVSVDAKNVNAFGISATDRAKTIRALANSRTLPQDLVRPGHVFPLAAKPGGVLERAGHTEAGVELAHLAGFAPAGAICEILKKDGNVARTADLLKFSKKHNIKILPISELVIYLKNNPQFALALPAINVFNTAQAKLPTKFGNFEIYIFKSVLDNREHTALVMGKITKDPVLVRIHSQCLTGDTLYSLKCDCGPQLSLSMKKIQIKGKGIILYLNQEGRGIGLSNKIKAYNLQDKGLNTVQANLALNLPIDARDFSQAAQMLGMLGARRIELLTNNLNKAKHLESFGIVVEKIIPLEIAPQNISRGYLKTKKEQLGHRLRLV